MKTTFVAAIAILAATASYAQNKDAQAPKASKADVQKLVDSIKGDSAKMAQFCSVMKLQDQYSAAAEKKDEKQLETLDKQMEEATKKLGPDFDRVTASELDDDSSTMLDGLAKSCS